VAERRRGLALGGRHRRPTRTTTPSGAILGGISDQHAAIRLGSGRGAAETFLDARIEDVMRFERWKAGVRPLDLLAEVAGALGRLRYGRG
jgi:ubiquinone biosynthesis protein COQ9